MDFFDEHSPGNFDIRNLRVSINSLDTKIQRNWPGRICVQAGLPKGVDALAISSMHTIWWGQSRLAYPGVMLPFLASGELLRWRLCTKMENQATGCAGGPLQCLVCLVGSTSPRTGFHWVFLPSTTTQNSRSWPRLNPDWVDWWQLHLDSWKFAHCRSFRNHTNCDLLEHDPFCPLSKNITTKNFWKWKKRLCVRWLGVINLTWKNLQIAKHKSVRWTNALLICAMRSVDFLRYGLSPRATSRTIAFSISNSFW